jgi:hypothetical protein
MNMGNFFDALIAIFNQIDLKEASEDKVRYKKFTEFVHGILKSII